MQKKNFRTIFFLALFSLCCVFSFSFSNLNKAHAQEDYSTLETSYSLFNINLINGTSTTTDNLPTNVGNQRGTHLCWSFATITAFETTLYKAYPELLSSTPLNFSEMDLAYNVLAKSRGLPFGNANFEVAYEYFSTTGPAVEQSWEKSSSFWQSDTEAKDRYISNLASNPATMADYIAFEYVAFPSRKGIDDAYTQNLINLNQLQSQKETLRNQIKYHIKNYGAVTSAIYSETDRYFSKNVYLCDSSNYALNHMITLVGWDDTFSFNGHTGAYIAQNSYGTNFGNGGFFYIMYDDAFVENAVCGFKRVGRPLQYSLNQSGEEINQGAVLYNNASGAEMDNQFSSYSENKFKKLYVPVSDGGIFVTNIYQLKSNPQQILSRIKIPTICPLVYSANLISQNNNPTNFKVYLLNNLSYSNISTQSNLASALANKFDSKILLTDSQNNSTFTASQTGFYTIELGENTTLEGDYFAIVVEYESGFVPYIDNNSNSNEDNNLSGYKLTYFKDSNSSWQVYPAGNNSECVLPLVVEATSNYEQIDCEVQDITKTYDGVYVSPEVVVNTPQNYEVSYTYNNQTTPLAPKFVDAGTYQVQICISAENYVTKNLSTTITINKKPIIVTPISTTKIYGDKDNLEFMVDQNSFAVSDIIKGKLSRTEGEDTGTYEINAGSLYLQSTSDINANNFCLEFVSGQTLTISKRTLRVEPILTSKTYGEEENPSIPYSVTNLAFNERATLSLNLTYTKFVDNEYLDASLCKNAGFYDVVSLNPTIESNASGFKASNYQLEFVETQNKFQIKPKTLYILAQNQAKIFGENDPEFSFSFEGNLEGETPSFVNVLSREAGEDVGFYKLTLGTLALANNGDFLASNYTLAIKGTPTLQIAAGQIDQSNFTFENQTFTYDGTLHTLSYTCDEGIVAEYLQNEVYSSTPITHKNVGEYQITIRFSKPNYLSATQTKTLTISKATLTILPDDCSKVYGEVDNITFTYSGNIFGQMPIFSGSLSHDGGESVGVYGITLGSLEVANNEDFLVSNYQIVLDTSKTLKITKRKIVVTPNPNQQKLYNTPDATLTYTFQNNLPQDNLTLQGSLFRQSGEGVGRYQITLGSLYPSGSVGANYSLELSPDAVFFEILPQQLQIKINDKQVYFGVLDNNFNYSYLNNTGSLVDANDNLNLVYECLDNFANPVSISTAVGIYTINAKANNPNYSVEITPGTYKVIYQTYTATFVVFGEIYEASFKQNSIVTLPEINLNRAGYTFSAWEVDGVLVESLDDFILQNDTTFVAKFVITKYALNYKLFGGEFASNEPSYYTVNSDFEVSNPSKLGCTFEGWYLDSAYETEFSTLPTNAPCDLTLYAKWQAKTYTANICPQQIDGCSISTPAQNATFGEKFSFYVLLDSMHNKSYSTMKVYATYDWNNAREEVPFKITSAQNESLVAPNTSTVAVCTIESVKAGNFSIEVENVTRNVYEIRFAIFGVMDEVFEVEHGGCLTSIPQVPQKEHYTQIPAVWNRTNFENITSDATVSAIYTPDVYKVTFVGDDGKKIVQNVTYGNDADTSYLNNFYSLGALEYFSFEGKLHNIEQDTTIKFTIENTSYVIYSVAIFVAVIVVAIYIYASFLHTSGKRLKHKIKLK